MRRQGRLARWGRCAALVVALVVLSACQVRTTVVVDVAEDGSGVVRVEVGLDPAAAQANPRLAELLRTDDLLEAGWTVSGPEVDVEGFTSVEVAKPFADVDEAEAIFAEVAGPDGPLQGFRLERERSLARTTVRFVGTVDLTGGLESFSDAGVRDVLDGEPLGETVAALEARLGRTLDEAFRFRVVVRLPGEVTSNAPSAADNGAVWQPRLSDGAPVELRAEGSALRTSTLVAGAVAVVVALLLVAAVVLRVVLRGQDRQRARAGAGGSPGPALGPVDGAQAHRRAAVDAGAAAPHGGAAGPGAGVQPDYDGGHPGSPPRGGGAPDRWEAALGSAHGGEDRAAWAPGPEDAGGAGADGGAHDVGRPPDWLAD